MPDQKCTPHTAGWLVGLFVELILSNLRSRFIPSVLFACCCCLFVCLFVFVVVIVFVFCLFVLFPPHLRDYYAVGK